MKSKSEKFSNIPPSETTAKKNVHRLTFIEQQLLHEDDDTHRNSNSMYGLSSKKKTNKQNIARFDNEEDIQYYLVEIYEKYDLTDIIMNYNAMENSLYQCLEDARQTEKPIQNFMIDKQLAMKVDEIISNFKQSLCSIYVDRIDNSSLRNASTDEQLNIDKETYKDLFLQLSWFRVQNKKLSQKHKTNIELIKKLQNKASFEISSQEQKMTFNSNDTFGYECSSLVSSACKSSQQSKSIGTPSIGNLSWIEEQIRQQTEQKHIISTFQLQETYSDHLKMSSCNEQKSCHESGNIFLKESIIVQSNCSFEKYFQANEKSKANMMLEYISNVKQIFKKSFLMMGKLLKKQGQKKKLKVLKQLLKQYENYCSQAARNSHELQKQLNRFTTFIIELIQKISHELLQQQGKECDKKLFTHIL